MYIFTTDVTLQHICTTTRQHSTHHNTPCAIDLHCPVVMVSLIFILLYVTYICTLVVLLVLTRYKNILSLIKLVVEGNGGVKRTGTRDQR